MEINIEKKVWPRYKPYTKKTSKIWNSANSMGSNREQCKSKIISDFGGTNNIFIDFTKNVIRPLKKALASPTNF